MSSQPKKQTAKFRLTGLSIDSAEVALVITGEFHRPNPEGGPPTKSDMRSRVRLKNFGPTSDVKKTASAVIQSCKYLKATKPATVVALLTKLQARLKQQAGQENPTRDKKTPTQEQKPQQKPARPARPPSATVRRPTPAQKQAQKEAEDSRVAKTQQPISEKGNSRPGSGKARQGGQNRTEREESLDGSTDQASDAKPKEKKKRPKSAKPKAEKDKKGKRKKNLKRGKSQRISKSEQQAEKKKLPPAEMARLQDYISQIYEEDIQVKTDGTGAMLQLIQDAENLHHFVEDETTINLLARTLAEERKKLAASELITNIMEIFFCFSTFSELHGILANIKLAETTLKIINWENQRYKKKWMGKEGNKKVSDAVAKQERLLFICFYVLLNMAENVAVEYKMIKKKVINHLVELFSRKGDHAERPFLEQLHQLAYTFLKRLSIFQENMKVMIDLGIIEKMIPHLAGTNEGMIVIILRLMFNLSFDPTVRHRLLEAGLTKRLVDILKLPGCQDYAVRLLYNISQEFKVMENDDSFNKAVSFITSIVIQRPTQDVLALAINLSIVPTNALVMASGDSFFNMVKRAQSSLDPLLMKLVRNISEVKDPAVQKNFSRSLHQLCGCALKTRNKANAQDFLGSCLGAIANIQVKDYQYGELIRQHRFLDFLKSHLMLGFAEDDVVLECVRVLSTLSIDSKAATMLGNSRLVSTLYDILQAKADDVDIVLQLVYLFYKLLFYPASRKSVTLHERLVSCILDLVIDPCDKIRYFANLCADIVMELDDWKDRVLERRFQTCNHYWLLFLEGGAEALWAREEESLPEEEDDDYFHHEHLYLADEFGAEHFGADYLDNYQDYGANTYPLNDYNLNDYQDSYD